MTATILPEIVQLPFGLGNLMFAQWLAIQGLSGQTTTEDMEMFARKGVFSSIGRAGAVATVVAVALTAVPAVDGLRGLRACRQGRHGFDRDQRRDRYQRTTPVLSRWRRRCRCCRGLRRHRRHRALRLRPLRTAATIMTAMATMMARRLLRRTGLLRRPRLLWRLFARPLYGGGYNNPNRYYGGW